MGPILLMEKIRQTHQLRLVVYPIKLQGFSPIPGVVWDFVHQQYALCKKTGTHLPQKATHPV